MSAPESDESAPAMRAADADRERTAGALAAHAAQGRLDAEELEERCQVAYRARTLVELERLTHDLPDLSPSAPTPTPAPPPPSGRASVSARGGSGRAQRTFQVALRAYAVLVLFWVGIWLAAGADYFWPVWPALGTGVVVGIIGAFAGFSLPRDDGEERRSLPE